MIARRLAGSLVLLFVILGRAVAQTPPVYATTVAPVPGSQITVTLVTFGLGEEVFERFGHNALWFHDASTLQD
ncbi:MAG TPA: hypothetical protein VIJ90_04780, partial [Gemmatimonadaceae bacterium]